jgi:hypothetical protein
VADTVNGCVGAQDADDEGDYINDLLMSQLYGVAGSGDIRAGRMVRSAQGASAWGELPTEWPSPQPAARADGVQDRRTTAAA